MAGDCGSGPRQAVRNPSMTVAVDIFVAVDLFVDWRREVCGVVLALVDPLEFGISREQRVMLRERRVLPLCTDVLGAGGVLEPLTDARRRELGELVDTDARRGLRRSIGVLSNPLLLWGIAFELALSAAIIYLPPLQELLGTAPLTLTMVAFTAPFPFIVWGADEIRRWVLRRTHRRTTELSSPPRTSDPGGRDKGLW